MSDAAARVDPDQLAQLVGGLDRAADQLDDLRETHRRAGELLVDAVRAPRRTGRLARSVDYVVDAHGVTVTAGGPGLDYVYPVHAAHPFLTDALAVERLDVVDLYLDSVTDALSEVR